MEIPSLAARDRACIWHPFTQMKTACWPIPIDRGEGAWLIGNDGTKYLDAFSSWWVNLYGHSHPYLIECLIMQARKLEHVVFTDFTHQPAVELAERLLQLLPSIYAKVFYSDNGSTAVETALKMVFQYWHSQNPQTKKRKMVSFKNGYHGDTFGAMALAGKGTFNRPFWPYLFEVIAIDPPYAGLEEESLKQLKLAAADGQIAGFIFEPQIQGVGGMRSHSLKGLEQLLAFCCTHEILTIADEVMTGFGRTGPDFVSQKLENPASIICLAKGLSGGMLPLAVTACSQTIYEAFLSNDKVKALLHGHSYYANPLACAVALGSLDLLQTEECEKNRVRIENRHQAFCSVWKGHPAFNRCETVGTILAIEYKNQDSYFHPFSARLKEFFLKQGILVRPMGNVLHIMPPYCIEDKDLELIYQVITESLQTSVLRI